jgi:hypothetical protein
MVRPPYSFAQRPDHRMKWLHRVLLVRVCAAFNPAVFVSAKYSLDNNLDAVLTDTFPAKPPKTIVAQGISTLFCPRN